MAPKQNQQDDDVQLVGKGFVVIKQMAARLENGVEHQWNERWMIRRSHTHAQRREISFQNRLVKAEDKLSKLMARPEEIAISGLVPINPKMKTNSPTAVWLLSQFDNLHLLVEEKGKTVSGKKIQ